MTWFRRSTPAPPPAPRFERDCWRSYELPAGRTWESFRYEVQDIWAEVTVDEAVTDSEAARDRMVQGALEQGYDVRVITRGPDGETVEDTENPVWKDFT